MTIQEHNYLASAIRTVSCTNNPESLCSIHMISHDPVMQYAVVVFISNFSLIRISNLEIR